MKRTSIASDLGSGAMGNSHPRNNKFLWLIEETNGKCEICGSSRNIEVHHIIPRCCKIANLDMDDGDNLIVLCSKCHNQLTPKRFLAKYGIAKTQIKENKRKKAINFLNECADREAASGASVIDIFIEMYIKGGD